MLQFRPHHGVCIANFVGRGYDEAFTQNMKQVTAGLKEIPDQEILLKVEEDVLCAKCPHCKGRCDTSEAVVGQDLAVLKACGLEEGTTILWKEFQQKVQEHILDGETFAEICHGCKWYDFCNGILSCRKNSL